MTQLQLTGLGACEIVLAGEPLTAFATDKVRALLVYLVLEQRAHERNHLAQFLWPGYGEESARQSLRQALYRLRHLLPDSAATPWILNNRQTVQFDPAAPVQADVTTFTQLLADCTSHAHDQLITCQPCLARLRQAVDLHRGDFLAGFTVADSDPFEEWRRVTQEQLHIQMLDALTVLANAAEAAGEEERALQYAQRQVALEPWLEAAHRQIMRILARRGQRAAAIAQYNRCRQVLAEELRATPDEATLTLYQQITAGVFDNVARRSLEPSKASVNSAVETLAADDRARASSQPELRQARSSSALPAHYLPATPHAIVGRTEEMATILTHLQSAQLLTLMGSGGMGKTRLALEIGRQTVQRYADGVWFVALAAVSSPSALAMTIATTMGLTLQGDNSNSVLCQLLQHKQLLLILDNFEHLLSEAAAVDLVIDLLATAPGVQILVTSRERLKLRNEQLFPLSALPFSPSSTLAEAGASPAVRLFVLALQRVQTNFQLTAANLAVVLRICQLVEGVPLGLELAAANSRGMPLSAIADAIEQSADFLGVDWRDVPERQRSMRAVFAWSWRLLSATEQRVLRQSAIFHGGFDYAAAQAVLGAMSAVLTALVDKSLLQWQAAATGEGRYAMHELLRQFVAQELQRAQTEALAVAVRHSAYYLAFMAEREMPLTRHGSREAADEIQAEIHNIQQAWRWAATHQTMDDTDLSAALKHAAYSLWEFCDVRRPRTEAEQMFRLVIEHATPLLTGAPDDPRNHQRQVMASTLLALHARTLIIQGKPVDAATTARQAIRLGQATANREGETIGAIALGQALVYTNQPVEAQALFEETLQLARRYRSQAPTSAPLADAERTACEYLALMTIGAGNYQGSRSYMLQALQLCQSLGKERGEQHSLHLLARLAYLHGDYDTALREYQQSLTLARKLGHQLWEAYVLIGQGQTLLLQGDYPQSMVTIEQGLTLAHQLDDLHSQSIGLAVITRLHCLLGNTTEATRWATHLRQFLETRAVYPESRSYGLVALAFHAQVVGAGDQALAFAEQAWQTGQEFVAYGTAPSLIMLGHAQTDLQRWSAAAQTYEAAINAYTKIGNHLVAAEAQAGLAQIALAQGDRIGALAQIEVLLPVLGQEPHAGYHDPFFIYLTGYRVLVANGDPRAATLLQQGYDLLHQDAAALDAESRHRFLTAVPLHRDLVTAYRALSAQS